MERRYYIDALRTSITWIYKSVGMGRAFGEANQITTGEAGADNEHQAPAG